MTTKQELQKKVAELQAQIDAMPDDKPKKCWTDLGRIISFDGYELPRFYVVQLSSCISITATRLNLEIYSRALNQGDLFISHEAAELELRKRETRQKLLTCEGASEQYVEGKRKYCHRLENNRVIEGFGTYSTSPTGIYFDSPESRYTATRTVGEKAILELLTGGKLEETVN